MHPIAIASIAIVMMVICQPMYTSATYGGAPATAAASTGPHGVTTATASVGQPQHGYHGHNYPAYPVVQGPAPVYHDDHYGYSHGGHGSSHGYGHGSSHGYGHGSSHGYGHAPHYEHGYHGHPGVHGQAGFHLSPHSAEIHGGLNVQAPHMHVPHIHNPHHYNKYGHLKHKYEKYYAPQVAYPYPSGHGSDHLVPGYYSPGLVSSGPILRKDPKVQKTENKVFITKVESPKKNHHIMSTLGHLWQGRRPSVENSNKEDKIIINQGANLGPIDV